MMEIERRDAGGGRGWAEGTFNLDAFLEAAPDVGNSIQPPESTIQDPGSEVSKSWQNMFPDWRTEESSLTHDGDDLAYSKMVGPDYDFLGLPPLLDEVSSPVTPCPAPDERYGVVDSQLIMPPTNIQIRNRSVPSFQVPVKPEVEGSFGGRSLEYSAKQRVRFIRKKPLADSQAGCNQYENLECDQGGEEPTQTATLEKYESKPNAAESLDGARYINCNACNAVILRGSDEERNGTQESADKHVETLTLSTVTSPSQSQRSKECSLSEPSRLPKDDVHGIGEVSKMGLASSKDSTDLSGELIEQDERPSMKASAVQTENQKSVTALDDEKPATGLLFKGFRNFPSGIGSIHVNAVTISCSCDKVGTKPHVQATVCDCYNPAMVNSKVVREPLQYEFKDRQSCQTKRGGFRRGFACVFFMGIVSTCLGLFASWSLDRQLSIWSPSCKAVSIANGS